MTPENEAQLRHESSRGMRANELLKDEILIEAFQVIDERLTHEWANSPARDTEGRERIWLMRKLLSNLNEHIHAVAETGKLASIQLERERNFLQRVKESLANPF